MDSLDLRIAHALQLDGRAPFARIAEVLGVSEHTVARRYRGLRDRGVLRVVGVLNGFRLGLHSWTLRLRCLPDAGPALAAALARRPDIFWVHLLSGGTEISCLQQVRTADELLLDRLPRKVADVSAHSLLRGFAGPGTWQGVHALTSAEAEALRPEEGPVEDLTELTDVDHALVAALVPDGRAGYAELAARAGTSESTARRRVEHMCRTRALGVDLDVEPAAFGFPVQARLWMSVRPSALAEVGAALAGHPETYFAAAITGPSNLVASITCRGSGDLYRYLTERVGSLDGVLTVESAPVLRTVKRVAGVADAASS